MYFWGSDFETLCEQNCRQYRVYADIYPKNENGGYSESPSVTYTATRGSSSAGAVSFETAAIVSVKIVRGVTSGAFSYGGAFGGQLTLVTTADTKIPANDTKIVISVSFVSDEGQETGKATLGTFFSESVASGQFTKTIKATDGVSKLNKYYVPDPEEFPMTAMDLFKKAAVAAGVDPALYEVDFKLNNPNITEAPLKKKGVAVGEEDPDQEVYVAAGGTGTKYHSNPDCSGMNGNVITMTRAEAVAEGYTKCTKSACMGEESAEDEYYTYREIAGMIASVNAGNAFVSAMNHLNISTPDVGLKREIPIKSVISYTDNEVVNKFSTTFWAQTYTGEGTPPIIDPLSEEYDPSVMVVDFPLSTDGDYMEMQENIDGQIGGISYNGIVIKKQGTGRQEIGDLLAFTDTYRNKKFDNVLIMGIVYDISGQGGFVETLYSLSQSEAKQQAKGISTNTRVDRLESRVESGGGGGEVVSGGVGEFTNEAKNSEIFNSYEDITDDNGTVSAKRNYINPSTVFAHVAGLSNSIDEDDSITSFSNMAAVLTGNLNKILSSVFAAILCGRENKIENSATSAITGGNRNSIQNANMACIAGGQENSVNGHMSFIGGGMNNKIMSTRFSVICGGSDNSISAEGAANAFIGCGNRNKIIASVYEAAILGGSDNTVAATGSGILTGISSSVDSGAIYSAVVCGSGNHVQDGYSAILCGTGNTVKSGSSAVIAGAGNTIESYSAVAMGTINKISGNNSKNCFVCGERNELENAQNCIVCGYGAKVHGNTLAIVVGNNGSNVFYVDAIGNAYAKSFNIIGETASEASAFSARSADNPDLSELTAQISEIKADIEALRAENQTLRAEIESLKANL